MSGFDFTDDAPSETPSHCIRCGKKLRNQVHCRRCSAVLCSELCERQHHKQKHAAQEAAEQSQKALAGCLILAGLLSCGIVFSMIAKLASGPGSGVPAKQPAAEETDLYKYTGQQPLPPKRR